MPVKGPVLMTCGNATSPDFKSGLNTADSLHLCHIYRECVGNKAKKWTMFVQVNRSHDAASVHTREIFVKYASRANTAMRRELYL